MAALVAVALLAGGGLLLVRDDGDVAAPAVTTTTVAPTSTTTTSVVQGTPGAPGIGDPYYPDLGNGGYDVQHYDLDLTWRAEEGVLDGVATVEAVATQDLSRFDLDLSGLEVRSVTVDGSAAEVERSDRELVVTPRSAVPDGGAFTAIVTYSGRPKPIHEGTDLFDLGWHTDGREAFVVSEPSGASTFFPVNDHPADKASYTFRITAPEDQTVAANGLLVGTDDIGHGTRAWTYDEPDPMASYLVQVAIGDFELVDDGEVDGVAIRHVLHRSLLDLGRQAVAGTADMVRILSEVYGPYPFDAYGVLAVDEDLGFALETQTLTIIGSDIAQEGRGAQIVLLHELAHQWVGDAVSPATWRDVWLNEGFASYAEWLYTERTGGPSAANQARRYHAVDGLDTPPGDPGPDELFGRSVYLRGGMTLQALRERIGDDDFFAVLRRWVDDHRGGAASTDDFIALAEDVSGEDLADLFQAWLYEPALPPL